MQAGFLAEYLGLGMGSPRSQIWRREEEEL